MESSIPDGGHMGVGPNDATTGVWWTAGPGDKSTTGMKDDVYTFNADGTFTFDVEVQISKSLERVMLLKLILEVYVIRSQMVTTTLKTSLLLKKMLIKYQDHGT